MMKTTRMITVINIKASLNQNKKKQDIGLCPVQGASCLFYTAHGQSGFTVVCQMTMHVNLFLLVAAGESDTESTSRRVAGAAALSAGVPGEQHQLGI